MSEIVITPKNWDEMQHYKDRKPAWIKLHKTLLDDYEYHCLPIASKALAPCIWLIASEYDDGEISTTLERLAFRLRMTKDQMVEALIPLIQAQFIILWHDASGLLAGCYPREEKRREEESKREETDKEEEKEKNVGGKRFSPPSIEEVAEYASVKGLENYAEDFYEFYGSKGWYVGKSKMKDWRLAYSRWCKNQPPKPQGKTGTVYDYVRG